MRTKALILSAMLGVAGVASSMAQGNVYSVNVVGYINLELTNTFSLIANQLDDGNGNLVVNLIPTAPSGTQVYKFNPSTGIYATLTRQGTLWLGASTMTLAPGEGAFVRKPPAATSIPLTFVGEVLQGTLVNPIGAGYDIYSSMVPQAGTIQTDLGLTTLVTGDQVYKFNPVSGLYSTFTKQGGIFLPSQPSMNVGEAFWIKANAGKDWTREFTVQ